MTSGTLQYNQTLLAMTFHIYLLMMHILMYKKYMKCGLDCIMNLPFTTPNHLNCTRSTTNSCISPSLGCLEYTTWDLSSGRQWMPVVYCLTESNDHIKIIKSTGSLLSHQIDTINWISEFRRGQTPFYRRTCCQIIFKNTQVYNFIMYTTPYGTKTVEFCMFRK